MSEEIIWDCGYKEMTSLCLNRGVIKVVDRIVIDSAICHGQACVKGTRIPVYQIIGMLANGDTIEELLEQYPSLIREDILACLVMPLYLRKSN